MWIDDCNSTGGSLRDGALLLKRDYNINVHGALYLVDRSKDRASLPPAKMGMVDPAVVGINVMALYDLADVSAQM